MDSGEQLNDNKFFPPSLEMINFQKNFEKSQRKEEERPLIRRTKKKLSSLKSFPLSRPGWSTNEPVWHIVRLALQHLF
jgi:hypothetical protein